MKSGKTFLQLTLISIVFALLSCAGSTRKGSSHPTVQHQISDDIYLNSTYNCQLSLPNSNWSMKLSKKDIGDGFYILELERSEPFYAYGALGITKHPQSTLSKFAGIGTYNPRTAKFTYIAGKPAFYASKPMNNNGFSLVSKIYKFVNSNTGFLFSFAFLSQWEEDEALKAEIDAILNSFLFTNEASGMPGIAVTPQAKGEKLLDVALLEMVDLRSNESSKVVQILTNELQDKLNKTQRFSFVERRSINQVVKEHQLQLTGMISDDSAVKIGNLIGAKYLVSSNLGLLENTYVVYAQITNAENGKLISSASTRCSKCSEDMLLNTIPVLVSRLISEI